MTSSSSSSSTPTTSSQDSKSDRWKSIEFNRYGISVGVLAIAGCLGGIGSAFAISGGVFMVAPVALATGLALSMVLAVAPMRFVLGAGILALVVDTIVILASLFL